MCNTVFDKIENVTKDLDVYGVDFAMCDANPLNTTNSKDRVK